VLSIRVLSEVVGRLETPFFQDYVDGAGHREAHQSGQAGGLGTPPKADLAYCRIAFDDRVPANVQFQARFGLDTTPVKVGDRVIAIGYSKMKVDRIADQNVHSFEANFNMKITTVRDVFDQTGPTGQEHPCFYVDDALEAGMSGGSVVTVASGGVPHVRGIVRSDETRAADVESEKPIPTALVSMLWPLMLMPASLPTTSGEIAGRTLLHLQREHLIIDQGNACDRIEFTQSATGQVERARWRN
jgi:hypothetical protein